MKKSLLGLMAISLIITGGLTYADNEFIVHDTTGGTITVYSQDKSYGITIQDKNLGATVVGTGETSYGYYYQWGNNHGNYAGTNTGTLNELLDADVSQWVNKGYSGDNDKFIIFNIINYNKSTYDYRSGVYYTNATDNSYVGDSAYNNLRGGGNDNQTGDATIVKGYDIENHVVINPENRQGPCPSGYHIPSAGEWQELMMLRCNANSGTCNSNTIKTDTNIEKARANYLSRNGIGTTFSNDLWLPLVGYRDYYDGDVGGQGDYARYRSSSPRGGSSPKYAWSLSFDASGVYPSNTNGRANGQSVRCFKNPDVFTVSFLDDGEVVTSGSIVSGGTWDEIIPTPSEKDGYHFDYRYVQGAEDTGFDFSGTTITGNISLYAKWTIAEYEITYNLNDGAETRANPTRYTVESGTFGLYQPTKTGAMFLGWTGSNGNSVNANIYITKGSTGNRTYNAVWGDFEDIDAYFISNTGSVSYITLMDRNMGARTDDITSTGSYGFHYQWGNNYGFMNNGYILTGTTKAKWNSSYDNNGYNGYTFIMGSMDYWTGNAHYNGLRGGSGDNENNNRGLDLDNSTNRQGSCPEGYHVPSMGEWENVYEKLGLSPNTQSVTELQNALNLPFAGLRYYSDSHISQMASNAYYWSSTPQYNNSYFAYYLYFFSSFINRKISYYRSYAMSLRCFSNDYLFEQPSMTIHPNGGTGAMILVEGNTIKSLGTPHRANSNFEGWYSNAALTTSVITGSTAPVDLYARWNCQSGYIENNSGMGCMELYTIIYELNDGVLSGNNATGYTIESETITLINPTKTGYTFTGRSGTELNSLTTSVTIPTGSTGDREYEANWEINQYTITFKDGDNEITSITADYGTGITPPSNPTKNGYKFTGWDPEVPATMPAENMTINAKWERNGSSGGGGGGGGGGGSSSKTGTGSTSSQTGNQINSNTGDIASTGTNVKEPETNTGNSIQTGSQVDSNTGSIVSSGTNVNNPDTDTPGDSTTPSQNDKTYSTEFQQAYEFAKGNGITTMPTIQKANMEGKLTRIAMAKMLSQYAINVLGKTPDTTQNNKFNDVTDKQNSDYDDGVTLAYQLGIMGQNMPNNKFRPNDEVTRAEFATALSRMLYHTSDGEYKSTDKYYTNHMKKLVQEGIITKDDPKMKELRCYVMIMLMRSAK